MNIKFRDCVVDAELSKDKCITQFGNKFRYHYIDYRFGNEYGWMLWNILGDIDDIKMDLINNTNDKYDEYEMIEGDEEKMNKIKNDFTNRLNEIINDFGSFQNVNFKKIFEIICTDKKSKIQIQVDKIKNEILQKKFKNTIQKYIDNIEINPINEIIPFVNNIHENHKMQFYPWTSEGYQNFDTLIKMIEKISRNIIDKVFSPIVDLYSVSRMIKLNDNYNDLGIVIFYCGDKHIQNVRYLLNQIYEC